MVFILLFVLLNALLSTGKHVISLLHLNRLVLKDQRNINHI